MTNMNIKLTSVQVVEALDLPVSSNTFVIWTKKGFINGTRPDAGKRGGNFQYSLDEVKRLKSRLKQPGVRNHLPESLKDDWEAPVKAAKAAKVKAPKIANLGEILQSSPDPTLGKILAELVQIRKLVAELHGVWINEQQGERGDL